VSDIRIQSIIFEPDALVIAYHDVSTDVRGHVVTSHQAVLSMDHPDYAEDAEALHHKAVKILRSALEDWASTVPGVPDQGDDEDEELGMGER
jgi:hypothetical protein